MTPDQDADTPDVTGEPPNRLASLPLFASPVPAPHPAESARLRAVPPPEPGPARAPRLTPPAAASAHRVLDDGRHLSTMLRPVPTGPPTSSSLADSPGRTGLPPAARPTGSPAPVAPTDAAGGADRAVDWGQVRAFRQSAAELLTAQMRDRPGLDEQGRREIGRALIVSMLNDHANSLLAEGSPVPSPAGQQALTTAIFDSLFGLGRLQPLVDDPYVENIEIRGFDQVFMVYGDGRVQRGPAVADSDEELIETLAFLASQSGRAFTPLNWELDLRLHGGHRLAARAWRCPRPVVIIRVHRYTDVDLDDLQRLGMVDGVLVAFLRAAVRANKAIVVAGSQGAGKTTLIRALINEIDPDQSIVTIETEYELHLDALADRHHRVVPFEARPGSGERGTDGGPAGEVPLQRLLYSSFRLNADRLIVGEVRGPEALQMLKAAQSSTGTLSTIHAHHARAAIERLATCTLEAGPHVTADFAYRLISSGVHLIVHVGVMDRTHTGGRKHRYVSEVIEVTEGENGRPAVTDVFTPGTDGRAVPRTRPSFLHQLTDHGFDPAWLDQVDGTWGPFEATDAAMRERR